MNVVIHPATKPTVETVLMHALELAKAGLLKDVVVVSTQVDGELSIAHAGVGPGDIAVAALFLESEVRKLCEIT